MKQVSTDAEDQGDPGMTGVRAVDRAVAILQCFDSMKPQMTVLEIQRRVGLSRPTLYRLLHTLVASGLIQGIGDPQRFQLSHGVMQLAHVWLAGLRETDIARPLIEQLRETTGETAALFLQRGDVRICTLEYPSRHVLAISRGVGDTGNISQGASGKAILAFLSEPRLVEFLQSLPDDARKHHLVESLGTTKRQGYAISRGEVFAGAVAIAAPYFDHHGTVAGSIGLFGPSARMTDDKVHEFARNVITAANTLSSQMGAPQSDASATQQAEKKPASKTRSAKQSRAMAG